MSNKIHPMTTPKQFDVVPSTSQVAILAISMWADVIHDICLFEKIEIDAIASFRSFLIEGKTPQQVVIATFNRYFCVKHHLSQTNDEALYLRRLSNDFHWYTLEDNKLQTAGTIPLQNIMIQFSPASYAVFRTVTRYTLNRVWNVMQGRNMSC